MNFEYVLNNTRALRGRKNWPILAPPAISQHQHLPPKINRTKKFLVSDYKSSKIRRPFSLLVVFNSHKSVFEEGSFGVRPGANFGQIFLPRRARVMLIPARKRYLTG
jgi:hypothetical protein